MNTRPLTPTCAPDCDHWLYGEDDDDGLQWEGSGDGDDY